MPLCLQGLLILAFSLASDGHAALPPQQPTERLPVHAKINGHAVYLIVDTGVPDFVLFEPVAKRLHLKVGASPPPSQVSPGNVPAGFSEPCKLQFWGLTINAVFYVIAKPEHSPASMPDGTVTGPHFLSHPE